MSATQDIQEYPKDSQKFVEAIVTMCQSSHTHSALEEAARVRIPHIRHTKGGGETSDSDRVVAELAYEPFLKPRPDVASLSATTYTGLSSTRRFSAPYSPAPKPPLELHSRARHLTDMPPTVRPLTQP
jgi:hypothetical protein